MTEFRSRLLALTAAMLATTAASAADWWMPHASYKFDIVSSYISRGKVIEDQPILSNALDLHFDFSQFGRLGFAHWDYSDLTGKYQHDHRRFMPETDWEAYYEYDWKFSDDFKLTTQFMPHWETFNGYPSGNPDSVLCWRLMQALKNPFVTPYYKIHWTTEPDEWWYYRLGLSRDFPLFGAFSLTPHVGVDFADNQGRIKRFGARKGGESYGAGILSVVAELSAEYAITEWLSVHALVGQFMVADSAGRDNLDEPTKRDITYGRVGFKLAF